ncbi:MAG: DUF3987 domain-containing protein [Bacteroidaceae bacterium]|nr:DUF3987 domain-containing protein [Bacteroidaceae bacterium]
MHFDIFKTISGKGERCTRELFYTLIDSDAVKNTAAAIAKGDLTKKRNLPAVTWQAWFVDGKRKNANAHHSALYMFDEDHIQGDVREFYAKALGGRTESELGIVAVHVTPSTHGLRIVAKCREGLATIADNQKWLAEQLGISTYDDVCKDFARLSFLVPRSYFIYIDESIFSDEPEDAVYLETKSLQAPSKSARGQTAENSSAPIGEAEKGSYQGISIRDIARRWLQANGGEPTEGDRNSQLFRLACELRYICEFNGETLLANLPHYGLAKSEMLNIVKSALHQKRNKSIPKSLARVISDMKRELKGKDEEAYRPAQALDHLLNSHECIDKKYLPPIFREYADIMPRDFKTAAVMSLLPMLGTVGSKIRAKYWDNAVQSPSILVEVEAPQASGKSLIRRMCDDVMQCIERMDNIAREREEEYRDQLRKAKNAEKQPEHESFLIRLVPPTTSVSMLLQRIKDAKGVHIFSFTDEMQIVTDAMKRGSFGDLRALMRNAFDNAKFGQDYKGDSATRCNVPIFYNTLHCGTPKVYSTYYNNTEDGTVTRVIFCSLPDQFGKDMPIMKDMTAKQRLRVDEAIARLNSVTMNDDEIREEETWLTDFDFVNRWAKKWCKAKQKLAVEFGNRDIDTFMRRSAVVGFRAAMLAWFLWDSHNKDTQDKTIAFAEWVAEYMLWRLCSRYSIEQTSNEVPHYRVWKELDSEFTTADVETVCSDWSIKTPVRNILYQWRTKNKIEEIAKNSYRKKQ